MNNKLFNELRNLMDKKVEYQYFVEELKNKPHINSILLNKGLIKIYFEDDLIPILIKYYEDKIKETDDKISKFKLTKTID